jgi:Ca2+-binding RTX toxin-like protein
VATSTQITIVAGSITQNYFGSGFTYSGMTVSGGTVTSTTLYDGSNGGLQYEISGLSHSAVTVYGYVSSGNAEGLRAYFLNGNDTINGSAQADLLSGYAGNDTISGGSGIDYLYGNEGSDTLNGDDGNDTLDGGTGNDVLNGGAGDDTYVVDSTQDIVGDTGGNDTIQAWITGYVLNGFGIENLALVGSAITGSGDSADNRIFGNMESNTLYGNGGNDTLDGGGGGLGVDTLVGGSGDDTYVVDSVSDTVAELAAEGTDTVLSSVSYALPDNVENLTLSGSLPINGVGNSLSNVLLGNAAANTLSGGSGDDHLAGGGGLDILQGGPGDDVYVVSEGATWTPNTLNLSGESGSIYSGTVLKSVFRVVSQLRDYTGDAVVDYVNITGFFEGGDFTLAIRSDRLGQNLAAGSYANAESSTFGGAGHPGLDFRYNYSSGSSYVFGNFSIAAIDISYGGDTPLLHRLVLDFEYRAGNVAAPALYGTFDFNDAVPPESVIELPATSSSPAAEATTPSSAARASTPRSTPARRLAIR